MIDLLSNIYLYILFIILDLPLSSRNKFPNRDGRSERRNVGRSILSSILDSCVWLHDCIDYRADRRVLIGGYAIRKFRFRKKRFQISGKDFRMYFQYCQFRFYLWEFYLYLPLRPIQKSSWPKLAQFRTFQIFQISNDFEMIS